MRKLLKCLMILCLLSGCSQAPKEEVQEETPMMGVVNPIKSYETLDEVNNAIGTSLELVEGVQDVRFSTITNTVAQINFVYNGYELCLRASFESQGSELAGTYGEFQESVVDNYTVLTYNFGVVVVYDEGDEHRTLYIKQSLSEEELNDLIENILK